MNILNRILYGIILSAIMIAITFGFGSFLLLSDFIRHYFLKFMGGGEIQPLRLKNVLLSWGILSTILFVSTYYDDREERKCKKNND